MEFNRIDWRPRTPAQCEVLKLICTGEGLSRIDIARRLDMPKMTVSNVAAELIRQGLVAEGEARAASGAGRRPIELSVAEGAPLVLGLCVARGACTALLCDLGLKVLQIERAEVRGPSDAFTEGALALLDRFQAALPRVGAIGISSIGPVDTQTGVILNPPDFHGIQEVPIAEIVARRYRKPVCFNNDVKCSALVEHLFGSARGYDDFLELSLSNGVGSGIVVGGRLYQNECGASGEIGHVSIDYAGPLCACGNRGCLECYASIPPMERRLRAVAGRDGDFRDFCRMRGAEAEAALRDMLDKLACALVGQVNMLNPQCVVVCNEGAFLRDDHLAYLERRVNQGKLSKHHVRPVRVLRSAFGERSALFGSAGVVLDRLFRT